MEQHASLHTTVPSYTVSSFSIHECIRPPVATASAGGRNQFDAKHAALDGSADVQHEFRLMAVTGDGAFVAGGLQVCLEWQ